jgi:hypothetical protein
MFSEPNQTTEALKRRGLLNARPHTATTAIAFAEIDESERIVSLQRTTRNRCVRDELLSQRLYWPLRR